MFASATDRQLLVDQVSRLVSSGSAPVALWGAGRVCKQLREGWKRVDLDEHLVGVVDDDPAKHGSTIGGLPIVSAGEALSRGVRGVIITAEGEMQDRMWTQRTRFAKTPSGESIRILCCPERFASKTWDDCLIDQYEHTLSKDAGAPRPYAREYPPADDRPAPAFAELLRSRIAKHAGAKKPAVCEIGSGSGKWTAVALPLAGEYHCVDYSERLLFEVIEHRFASDKDRLHLHHDETARLAGVPDASIDFVFSIDVFVHFKVDLVHQFMLSIRRVLRPGGSALLHLADWNAAHVKVWQEHYQRFHAGGTTPLHAVHPDWLRVSGESIGLNVRTLDVDAAWGYFAELSPR